MGADQPVGRVGGGQVELVRQVLGQRRLARQHRFEIELLRGRPGGPRPESALARRRDRSLEAAVIGLFGGWRLDLLVGRRIVAALVALQQRVALDLGSSTKASTSRFDICSSLIACCSWGVMTSDWPWRSSSFCLRAMVVVNLQGISRVSGG
jgi:hypothetical protein